jgi:hypothetical protein
MINYLQKLCAAVFDSGKVTLSRRNFAQSSFQNRGKRLCERDSSCNFRCSAGFSLHEKEDGVLRKA